MKSKEKEIAITVKDLHVYYRDMKRFSLKKGFKDKGSGKIFKAVKGVSFEVPKGQILGICGKNGSGKSTLLRAISGIFSPDKGSINLHGNSISLLSIGVGFQKQLTGLENIYLSGMLLGYSKEEIATVILPKMMFDDDSFEPGLFTYVWNKIFKKSLLYPAQMNVPDSVSLGEDAACVYPAVLNAECLCITDDCLYHYRQRADSMLKISESYRDDYCGYKLLYSYLRKSFHISVIHM